MSEEEAKATQDEPDASSEAEPSPPPASTPAPKKKKKKKTESDAEAPSDPRAVAIATAFDAGNFQRVRELAAELAKSDDAALRAVGLDYATRIAVDPIQIAFLGLCAVGLLTIIWIYVPH